MNTQTDPYAEGYRAGLFEHDPRVCPYDKMTKEWQAWNRGHQAGLDVILNGALEIIETFDD